MRPQCIQDGPHDAKAVAFIKSLLLTHGFRDNNGDDDIAILFSGGFPHHAPDRLNDVDLGMLRETCQLEVGTDVEYLQNAFENLAELGIQAGDRLRGVAADTTPYEGDLLYWLRVGNDSNINIRQKVPCFVSLKDYAEVITRGIYRLSDTGRPIIYISGNDMCSVSIENNSAQYPDLPCGFAIQGDSFCVDLYLNYKYKHLSVRSRRGPVNIYAEGRHVYTLPPGMQSGIDTNGWVFMARNLRKHQREVCYDTENKSRIPA